MKQIYQTPETIEVALRYNGLLASSMELFSDDAAPEIVGDDEILVREWSFEAID